VGDELLGDGQASALAEVQWPAYGLMAASAFDILIRLAWIGWISFMAATDKDPNLVIGARIGIVVFYGALTLFGLVFSAIILYAANQMRQLKKHGLCMAASILSLVPCVACCFSGVPLGIWSLVVLSRPDVKAAFTV
jgi:hypothetical protein